MVRRDEQLRLGEWACLACIAERPAHGFAVATCLAPTGELGRAVALSRPLTYRAIERLAAQSMIEVVGEERGRNGLTRTVYGATAIGRAALGDWLGEPVDDVTIAWSELLLKVVVHQRLGVDVEPFVARQRLLLAALITALDAPGVDAVDVWHDESARAAARFLDRVTPLPHAHEVDPA